MQDPTLRPSVADLKNHPFLTKGDKLVAISASMLHEAPSESLLKQLTEAKAPVGLQTPCKSNFLALPPTSGSAISRSNSNGSAAKKRSSVSPSNFFERRHSNQKQSKSGQNQNIANARIAANVVRPPPDSGSDEELTPLRVTRATRQSTNQQPEAYVPAFVSHWVDYSSKYGIAYALTTGQIGLFFNDNTKMIASKDATEATYLSKQQSSNIVLGEWCDEQAWPVSLLEYPPEFKKKVTLFRHFQKYFNKKKLQSREPTDSDAFLE